MIHIANYWDTNSPLDIRVYSNCEQVDLYLNDKLVSSQDPDDNAFTNQLAHPPFTFKMEKFVPGTLRAVGKINGEEAASDAIQTPGKPSEINIEFDLSGRKFEKNKDIIFVYASIIDQNRTVVHSYNHPVQFSIEGPGSLIGQNPINTEAGIATILLQSKDESGEIKVTANTNFNEQSLNGTKSIRIE
jgi:beta-galactosidase